MVVLVGQGKALVIAIKGAQVRRHWSKLREWLAATKNGSLIRATRRSVKSRYGSRQRGSSSSPPRCLGECNRQIRCAGRGDRGRRQQGSGNTGLGARRCRSRTRTPAGYPYSLQNKALASAAWLPEQLEARCVDSCSKLIHAAVVTRANGIVNLADSARLFPAADSASRVAIRWAMGPTGWRLSTSSRGDAFFVYARRRSSLHAIECAAAISAALSLSGT